MNKKIINFFLFCILLTGIICLYKNKDDIQYFASNLLSNAACNQNKIIQNKNEVFTIYNDIIMNKIINLIKRNATYDDKELINVIKELFHYPNKNNILKLSNPNYKSTPQAVIVDGLLKKKKNGFFIEAGGFDGEYMSNSAFFERYRDWTGLIVEVDPYYYIQIIGKNRKAYSINSCISYQPSLYMHHFQEDGGWAGKVIIEDKKPVKNIRAIPCFPLASLLIALEVSHVDYFSMDIEGLELQVLKSIIPNKDFQVDVFTVEYLWSDKNAIKAFMASKNYTLIKELTVTDANDYIFARKEI